MVSSWMLPIDNQENLVQDLENDELVNNELSNLIGISILKGGRFIALASGLMQIANHMLILNLRNNLLLDGSSIMNLKMLFKNLIKLL